MKRLAVLGSTGSIGHSTLAVVRQHPREFRVTVLAAHSQVQALAAQAREFRPEYVCVSDPAALPELRRALKGVRTRAVAGCDCLCEAAGQGNVDEVVMAISGAAALAPLVAAINAGKDVVLANKESLALAGDFVMRRARARKVMIKPVDSEQSAIWQCLDHQPWQALRKIILTASGGPFRAATRAALHKVRASDALQHPRWKMGRKITVDSATLMNKGLECIEAMHLFGVRAETIEVVVHPQAIVHSMVEFADGVVMAQLSVTDMRIPIQYALSYPRRLDCGGIAGVDFSKLGALTFEKPDRAKFPCLRLAEEAAREGGSATAVLNAANEVAVDAFLKGALDFYGIPRTVERVLSAHRAGRVNSLAQAFAADAWAREEAARILTG